MVESGVKNHNPNPIFVLFYFLGLLGDPLTFYNVTGRVMAEASFESANHRRISRYLKAHWFMKVWRPSESK